MFAALVFFVPPNLELWLDSAALVALREANARAASYAWSLTAKVRQ